MIYADRIEFSYVKGQAFLKNISLKIEKGAFVGIIGPNGSGKTTLLRLLSGILKQDTGIVQYNGRDIQAISTRELAKLRAFVPQESPLDFDYTVLDIVEMGRNPYQSIFGKVDKEGKAKVCEAIDFCKLKGFEDRNARQLSGGEWQRVVLARALAQDTDIIFLDEPTHFLDIYYQLQFMNNLKKLNRQGRTIVVVLHDLNLAYSFCDSCILMKNGSIVEYDKTDKVITEENIREVFTVEVKVASQSIVFQNS